MIHQELMRSAIAIAESALKTNDVPVGALIVDSENNLISTGYNEREAHQDPTAHAEVVAIRRAAQKLGTWRLDDCKLVVTLEPCAMCAGAIAQSRINTLIFGAWDEKAGAVGSVWDVLRDPRAIHKMEVVGGVLEAECAQLLTNFFRQ
ncbi:MAG: nucleoside deaminase [Actinobacteria bacterium]|nr:nucleoside deaminase [Actinomycetota bacterium]